MPAPESRTVSSTASPSTTARMSTVPFSGVNWMALATTLDSTWCSRLGSPSIGGYEPQQVAVEIYRTGFKANDAYTAYIEMGKPKTLTGDQLAQLQGLTADKPEMKSVKVGANGAASVQVPMRANDVVLVKIAQ